MTTGKQKVMGVERGTVENILINRINKTPKLIRPEKRDNGDA